MRDTLAIQADSVVTDSVAADSLALIGSHTGYVLQRPARREPKARTTYYGAESWVMVGLVVLIVAVSLRVRSNRKYLAALLADITDVRERQNLFDDTVRESFLLILLNVLWSCCAGVMLYGGISIYTELAAGLDKGLGMGVCAGVTACYTAVMSLAYWVVGNVFSNKTHTSLWIKGFLAEQGLSVGLLLPLALLVISYPAWTPILVIIALNVFGMGKIVFIWKGFRIFFTEMRSWLLFLYYLCSLEIVPLILTSLTAMGLCSIL
ncbi:MAG: DUF4271 domain-containing protein [Muribaculum sp.]|nr:DUF4271 domain-containing protein [Muribaculum sp.]